jgi:putative SOS response-associated peptidase YedK
MPVILNKTSGAKWIDLSTSQSDTLDLLIPCPSENLKAHTIGPLINDRSSNRNTPEVIKPFNYQTGDLLF